MRVKSGTEIAALDEELNLFEEEEWNFFDVGKEEDNFEFFNDVRDVDFLDTHSNIRMIVPIAILGVLILISGIHLYRIIMSHDDMEFDKFKTELTSEYKANYIKGKDVSSEDFIEISKKLQDYFKILEKGKDYKSLNRFCEGNSNFYTTYKGNMDKMRGAFDEYDCYARMMSDFGKSIKCNKIDRAIVKDNVVYVYADLVVPDKDSIYEWLHLYSYNMTKYFTTKELTKCNIARFLLDTMEENPVPSNVNHYVFQFSKIEDDLVLMDDSQIVGVCNVAYNYTVSQVSKILGGSLSTKK